MLTRLNINDNSSIPGAEECDTLIGELNLCEADMGE